MVDSGRGSETTKEELMDTLHWTKQILGLILGATAGVLKFTGFPTVVGFAIILSGISLFYVWNVIKADHIEAWDIVSEAFGPGFFSFMLAWVLSYTFL